MSFLAPLFSVITMAKSPSTATRRIAVNCGACIFVVIYKPRGLVRRNATQPLGAMSFPRLYAAYSHEIYI
jgi:hypothetical protein